MESDLVESMSCVAFRPTLPLVCEALVKYYGVVTIVHIEANVPWKTLRAKGGNWVATCDPLKLTVQAATFAELMEDIGLTLNALLKDLLNSNELERFLSEQGWRPLGKIPSRPAGVRFDVPFCPAMISNGPATELRQ